MKLMSAFYGKQVEYGANKFMELMDWKLTEVYSSIEEEYRMVRERAGFIDYPFQGAIGVAGRDAFKFLQRILVNDLRKISPGKAIYSSMLDETGKIIDDITAFWMEEEFFIINSGPEKSKTIEWLKKNTNSSNVYILEIGTCFQALQGPKSREVLEQEVNLGDLPFYGLKKDTIRGIPVLIARVGFSGELGYELYVYPEYAHQLWDVLIELGKKHNVGPYGIETTVIVALEKGYLVETDFYEGSTPLEVGLGWTVAFDKEENFIGKEALLKRRSEGLKTKLMGFEVYDPKVVVVEMDNIFKGEKQVGQVTFPGAYSPGLKKNLGRGWIEIGYANEGEELEVEHENKKTKIKLGSTKWYDPDDRKLRA